MADGTESIAVAKAKKAHDAVYELDLAVERYKKYGTREALWGVKQYCSLAQQAIQGYENQLMFEVTGRMGPAKEGR